VDFLSVTGGHRVDLDAFRLMLDTISNERGWRHCHAVQPAAQRWLDGNLPFDAVLLHDIPGLRLKRGEPPTRIDPEPWVKDALVRLFDAGKGIVVLHHALAGWPSWDGWADAIGGRFLYAPGDLHGEPWPSSGTRITSYTAQVIAPDHPVCDGVEDFELTDELYCCPVFLDRVVPLVRTNADMSPGQFISTYEHVLVGEDAAPRCDQHPPTTDVIAWATSAGKSPIVFIEPGDAADTFGLPMFRRLLANALAWVTSPDAQVWAASQRFD
jgi:uncharacterized protein